MIRNGNLTPDRRRRYWRITLASVVLMVVGAMVLPLTGYVYVGLSDAYAQGGGAEDANPRANYWRAVREGSRVRVRIVSTTAPSPAGRCRAAKRHG